MRKKPHSKILKEKLKEYLNLALQLLYYMSKLISKIKKIGMKKKEKIKRKNFDRDFEN